MFFLALCLVLFGGLLLFRDIKAKQGVVSGAAIKRDSYWFILNRKSNIEKLYKGVLGDEKNSILIKTFVVKTGIPGERPTPLPSLMGRDYWIITEKTPVEDNPETAPYYLTLNIPVSDDVPYGPQPYMECNGQCNWQLPGAFGLHGIGGDESKISPENPGSSGCIRHRDEDITYLYNLLDLKDEVRYYIYDI